MLKQKSSISSLLIHIIYQTVYTVVYSYVWNIQNRIQIADMVVILLKEGNAFVIDCKPFPVA